MKTTFSQLFLWQNGTTTEFKNVTDSLPDISTNHWRNKDKVKWTEFKCTSLQLCFIKWKGYMDSLSYPMQTMSLQTEEMQVARWVRSNTSNNWKQHGRMGHVMAHPMILHQMPLAILLFFFIKEWQMFIKFLNNIFQIEHMIRKKNKKAD